MSGLFHFMAAQVSQRERTEPRRNSARLWRRKVGRTELQEKAASESRLAEHTHGVSKLC